MIKKILKENKYYLITIISLIIVLSIIIKSPLHDYIISFDYSIINFFDILIDDKLTVFFSIITNSGVIYIPIVIIVFIFLYYKNKWYFYIQTIGYGLAILIAYISKLIIARQRPLEALIKIPSSYSFPSGHTLTSLVFYCTLFYLVHYRCEKKVKIISFILCFLLIITVAISRIYLKVHYFSDVLGGFIIGIPCCLMIINIVEKNFKEKL